MTKAVLDSLRRNVEVDVGAYGVGDGFTAYMADAGQPGLYAWARRGRVRFVFAYRPPAGGSRRATGAAKGKRSGYAEARRLLERNVVPKLGEVSIRQVTVEQVRKCHRALAQSEGNRTLTALSAVYGFADVADIVPAGFNPTRHVKRNEEAGELYRSVLSLIRCDHQRCAVGAQRLRRLRNRRAARSPGQCLGRYDGGRQGSMKGKLRHS
ncbi:MAG: hypothetical protein VYE73_18840 [Acidobacteriota bacterium]|nr:hypothetical protein [Acidobacteriota bacterium]